MSVDHVTKQQSDTMTMIWFIVMLGVITPFAESSCMYKLPNDDADGCEYKGVKIAVNETYTDETACFRCSCGLDKAMQCCGYGHQAGVFAIPDACFMLKHGCEFTIVMANDHSKPCNPGPIVG